jgi:hypothetical protein
MCLVREKKARWYVERGLARVVAENPLTIILTFEPKGTGRAGDEFYTRPRPNVCAGCGSAEGLTLHHIVPHCYRRHFPEGLKSHSCHDLVPLCVPCHGRYESAAAALKKDLAREHGAPLDGGRLYDRAIARVRKAASALERARTRDDVKIPPARIAELEAIVKEHYGVSELTPALIEAAACLSPHVTPDGYRTHGSAVIGATGDLQAFVERWRRHFLESLRPVHMPEGWRVDREVET